jgi:hypothetical protein
MMNRLTSQMQVPTFEPLFNISFENFSPAREQGGHLHCDHIAQRTKPEKGQIEFRVYYHYIYMLL